VQVFVHLAVLSIFLSLPACDRPGLPSEPLVAAGNGVTITTREMQGRIDEMSPALRSRYTSVEAKRELLDTWVLSELMAREAELAGLANGPDFQAGGKKQMVQRLVLMRFRDPEGPRTVSDAEVRAYYGEHAAEYVQPVKMRVAHITFEAPEGSPGRSRRGAEARKIRDRIIRDASTNPDAFEAAITEVARTASPVTQGAFLGLLTRDELARAFTPEIADVAWGLSPNAPSSVLASPRGFHILQGYGGQPEVNVTVDQARGAIQLILYQARMADAYRKWTARLREQARVRIDESELAKVGDSAGNAPGSAAEGR
jgi:peptidyl-prolyl cis-trans isomerase C